MTFVADTMLGKLSRWLRILGYDTTYDPKMTLEQLAEETEKKNAVFLTKRRHLPINAVFRNVIFISQNKFEDQLKFIVEKCGLSMENPIFTRCLKCNVTVTQISKDEVGDSVLKRTYDSTHVFFKCPVCDTIYWYGTHYHNTMEKIRRVFQTKD